MVKKKSACNAGGLGSIKKIPQRRGWQPNPVFLPGESHGQRSLVDYSKWGRKALDTTDIFTFPLTLKKTSK